MSEQIAREKLPPLHRAAWDGNVGAVERLVHAHPSLLNAPVG